MKKIIVCLFLFPLSVSVVSPSYASLVTPATHKATESNKETVKSALAEFKNLSKKERKERLSEAKKEWKKFKKSDSENKNTGKSRVDQIVLIILAVLLPPLAVYLHQGEINGKFWISVLLTILFFLPGVIYALLVVTDNA